MSTTIKALLKHLITIGLTGAIGAISLDLQSTHPGGFTPIIIMILGSLGISIGAMNTTAAKDQKVVDAVKESPVIKEVVQEHIAAKESNK